ncbi:armadillo-type protein [Polychytrium aggregatum]|uniref:armadillo-type protein n=1 Tax=Polychytrium aggregatum TaxID=110093 RepID=UPI0022FEE5B8|nr:armadillo-type protein [Polychytrium aggregatum]KAI9207546.1 armadillo-type protein [Polychytrium aggregatum]
MSTTATPLDTQALGLLSPLYVNADTALAYRIVEALMKIKTKTLMEVDAIKVSLKRVFEKLGEHTQTKVEDAPKFGKYGYGYGFFVNLLTPHDENAYDILAWALETFTLASLPPPGGVTTAKTKKPLLPITEFKPLTEFINSLSHHSRATPPLIRYGACICLHSALTMCPTLLNDNKHLYMWIISGAMDTDYLSAFLYLSMLEKLMTVMEVANPGTPRPLTAATQSSGSRPLTARSPVPGGSAVQSNVNININDSHVSLPVSSIATAKETVRQMIISMRNWDERFENYDELFQIESVPTSRIGVMISDILDLVVKMSPTPLAPKLLHKMVNSLEYLSKPLKLKQLELIRLWGSRSEEFDPYLIQTVIPLLSEPDEDIQISILKVLQALIPGFDSAAPSELAFTWSYLVVLMDPTVQPDTRLMQSDTLPLPNTEQSLLRATLALIKGFPLLKLNQDSREELLDSISKLIFARDESIREIVYDLIMDSKEFWIETGQDNEIVALLILALGDDSAKCAKKVISYILAFLSPEYGIVANLTKLSAVIGGPLLEVIKCMDELANQIAKDRVELREIIDSIISDDNADMMWNFFLSEVLDNGLVKPDEYDYSRNFIQSPFWVALLMTKLGVSPPPQSGGDLTSRNVVPSTPAGKRRFLNGFLSCLLPTCGISDPLLRYAACFTVIRCCFRSNVLVPAMMRALLETVSQHMLPHKQWTFQISGLDILRLIIRLKLQSLSPAVYQQYIDHILDVVYNTPNTILKIGALEVIETILLVFPALVNTKIADIRDICRVQIVDKSSEVAACASRIYPLIFKCVSATIAEESYLYLKDEVAVLTKSGLEKTGDPLVAGLTKDEIDRITYLSLEACGGIPHNSLAPLIVRDLMPFLSHKNPLWRLAAFRSILQLLPFLDHLEAQTALWILLPLYADTNRRIRVAFSRYLSKLPFYLEGMSIALAPHPDDSFFVAVSNWEDILLDGTFISVNSKNMSDLVYSLDSMNPAAEQDELAKADNGFHIPTISAKLMSRIKALATAITGQVSTDNQVIYYLQELQRKSQNVKGVPLLVLSEFCCQHDSKTNEISDILVGHLCQEITIDNRMIVEASMLGLRNISGKITAIALMVHSHCLQFSPAAFKLVLAKLAAPPLPNEGDIIALLYLVDLIAEISANKAPDLLKRYIPIITSQRHTTKKRLFAIYLCVELAIIAGVDEMGKLIDAIQVFFDSTANFAIKSKILASLGRLMAYVGSKHPFFKDLLATVKENICDKDPAIRMRSIEILKIFIPYLQPAEAMWFCFLYLADPNAEVRSKGREMMINENMLEFAYGSLKGRKRSGSKRNEILQLCKLPSIQRLGVTINTNVTEAQPSTEIVLVDDPFNIKYYSSDRRKKFTEQYRLSEKNYEFATEPLTKSVMDALLERAEALKAPSPEVLAKSQWLLDIDTITILHECMKAFPQVANDHLDSYMITVERLISPRARGTPADAASNIQIDSLVPATPATGTSTLSSTPMTAMNSVNISDSDIEAEIHRIDLMSNLLFAYDGVDSMRMQQYLERLVKLIEACNEKSNSLREALYSDMESTFYFFSEYVDVPIVSQDQYETLENLRSQSLEATLEIVKSGNTEKLMQLEDKKKDLNTMVEKKSERLRRLTIVGLHCTSGLGLFYAITQTSSEDALVKVITFLAGMLDNEHRGIRITTVEAILMIINLQLEADSEKTGLITMIHALVKSLVKRLKEEQYSLYRRKADIINLVSQLLVFVSDRLLRIEILQLFVNFWKDPDSEVRIASINMVKFLGESGMAEIGEAFVSAEIQDTTPQTPPDIMKEIAGLLANPEYDEKNALQDLLKWRFQNATIRRRPTTTVGTASTRNLKSGPR